MNFTRHQCVPIRTDRKIKLIQRTHSQTHAGFEDVTLEFDETECPLCHRKYPIGQALETARKIVAYDALEALNSGGVK